ncbi:MAG: hypothetical protein ACLFUJ_03700 [Phycisphaerae bacterium]
MIRFWAICSNTFIQTIRQPVYLVLLMITFLAMAILVPQSNWTMGLTGGDFFRTDQIFLREMGLATLLVSGLLLAAFSASNVIGREIRDKTALTVVSKPISRLSFVMGKYVGVTMAVTLGFYLAMIAFLLAIRHGVMATATDILDMPVIVLSLTALGVAFLAALAGNYLFGWTFTSSMILALVVTSTIAAVTLGFVGKGWQIVDFGTDIRAGGEVWHPFAGGLIAGLVLTFLAVQILVAIAVASSARFGEVLTLLICLGMFAVGMIHPFLFGRHSQLAAARLFGWLFPKLSYFDKLDAISNDKPIPLAYLGYSAAYALLYITAVLSVGLAVFQTRQIEASTSSSTMPGTVSLLTRLGQAAGAMLALVVVPLMLSNPANWTVAGLGAAIGFFVLGAGGFVLWTLFGRGVRWAWALLLAIHVLQAIRISLVLTQMPWTDALRLDRADALLQLQLAINLVAIVLLVLPKTRRHVREALPSGADEMNLETA